LHENNKGLHATLEVAIEKLGVAKKRIAELEAALRQLLDAVEGAAAHRHTFIPEARAQARKALQKST
jgi:hypothetical protein